MKFLYTIISRNSQRYREIKSKKRIINNSYDEHFNGHSDLYFFKLKNRKELKLQFIEIPSQDRFHSIALKSLRKCYCVLLIYDITDRESFYNLENLFQEILEEKSERLKSIYLIENKIDRTLERKVNEEKAIEFAKKNNLRYFKISCKENLGIQEFLEDLGIELIKIIKTLNMEE